MPTIIFSANTSFYLYNFRLNLMKKMLDSGYTVIAIAPKDNYSEKITKLSIKYIDIKLERKSASIIQNTKYIISLYYIFKKYRPNIVHNFTIKPVIFGTIVARLLGVDKIINSITGLGHVFIAKSLMRKIVGIFYKWSFNSKNVQVIFQNIDDYNYFLERKIIHYDRAVIIYGSGVDITYFSPVIVRDLINQEYFVFGFFSRMLKSKGIVELIKSFNIVRMEYNNVKLILAGGIDHGNPSSVSERFMKENSDGEQIIWKGHIEDVKSELSLVDVVILPSYREGLPKSLLEALSMELPVIATDVPGSKEVVLDKQTGILVKPKDINSLVKAMYFMIKNPIIRKNMGREGRKLVLDRFNEDIVLDKTLSLYYN